MTTKLEQAARQALEALEVSTDWDVGAKGKQLQSMKAITALREALDAPVRTKDLTDDEVAKAYMECTGGDIIARCRAVIAADREKNCG